MAAQPSGGVALKIVATADLHGELPNIQPCDILILGGDICPDYLQFGTGGWERFDTGEQRQRHWLDTDFRKWLNRVPAERVVGIAGNHDYVFEHDFLIPKDLRWTYLRDDLVEIDGVRIWGTPWVPNLPRWAFYASDQGLEARASIIPPELDFLVTHGPPYEYGDYVPGGTEKQASKYGNREGVHVGDKHLNAAIVERHPKRVICGHIHEAYGHYDIQGSEFGVWNVALMDAVYNPVNAPVTFEL
jgi:Icc-related predicted phosphoesterase